MSRHRAVVLSPKGVHLSRLYGMPAVSIRQPHASRILTGDKIWEYRTFPCRWQGSHVLLYASSTPDPGGEDMATGAILGIIEIGALVNGEQRRCKELIGMHAIPVNAVETFANPITKRSGRWTGRPNPWVWYPWGKVKRDTGKDAVARRFVTP